MVSSLSPPCCAECEVAPAALLCEDEDLIFCAPCSKGLHVKRARTHHILKPFRICDHCETAVALLTCALCGGRGAPLVFCFPCSSDLHSRKARAHHKLDPIPFPEPHLSSQDVTQGNQGSRSPFAETHANTSDTQTKHSLPCFKEKDIGNPVINRNPNNTLTHRKPCRGDKVHGPAANRNPKSRLVRPEGDKENHGPVASRNPSGRPSRKQQGVCSDVSGSSSEEDTSEDDETYGTKKYRKGSVTLEAFVVDVHDHEDGQPNRGARRPELDEDQPEGGVQAKIRKMLELGLHPDTPDIEAQQALKNAQRLLTKHNLQQADVLKGGLQANKQAFKGGMRMVELRSRDKNKQAGRFEHWVYSLALIVAKYFDTQYFVQKQSVLKVVFYGIRQNVDCAGYAFAATFNRISKLSADYVPSKQVNNGKASKGCNLKAGSSQGLYSRVSRMSYRNGLVEGLFETVKATKLRQKPGRKCGGKENKQKLNNEVAMSAKETVDIDSDSSNDECGTRDAVNADSNSGDDCVSDDADYGSSEEWDSHESTAINALVVHSKKIGDDFLKEKKIKITTRKQDSPIIWDGEAFMKGKRDSKTIDLGQKGITAKARKTAGV
eukprot:c8097_g1_i2 orf=249-2066(-)